MSRTMGKHNSSKGSSQPPIPGKQQELRRACQTGDVRKIAALLNEQPAAWKRGVQKVVGPWMLKKLGLYEDWLAPARLDYVYDDDMANMPIHYIALGAPVSLLSRMLSSLCLRSPGAWHASQRAELLRYLLDHSHCMQLTSLNVRLETPVHCALRSCSFEVLEVLLTHEPASGQPGPGAAVTEKDADNRRPLDVALLTQQWPAVRLLIAAGALSKCPELDDARRELQQLLPCNDAAAKHGGLMAALPNALGKVVKLMLGNNGEAVPAPPVCESSSSSSDATAAGAEVERHSEEATIEEELQESTAATIVLANTTEVVTHRQKCVEHVAYVLDVNEAIATALLECCHWNEHRTVDTYFANPQGALQAAGVSTASNAVDCGLSEAATSLDAGVAAASPAEPLPTCPVCFDEVPPEQLSVKLLCSHVTCDSCWKGILKARLSDGDVDRTRCPYIGCHVSPSASAIEGLLSSSQLARYQQLLALSYADINPAIKWCPKAGCGRCLTVDAQVGAADGVAAAIGSRRALDVRCSCGHCFCFTCLGAPHEPATCSMVREWDALLDKVKKEAASRNEDWMHVHTKPCVGCGSPIEKNGGCNHIVCTRCRRHFCWVCGSDWSVHAGEVGVFYRCNRFVAAEEASALARFGGGGLGLLSLLGGIVGRIQDAATKYRLSHYIRRYHASECDARQLHVAAEWMSALLLAGLPPQQVHAIQACATDEHPPSEPEQLPSGHANADRPGLAQIQDDLASNEGGVTDEGDYAAAEVVDSEMTDPPHSTVPPGPNDAGAKAENRAPYGYLKDAAEEAISARRVLQNSYIAGYNLAWGDRRRNFEEIQGRLEAATEQCSVPLALMPDVQAIMQTPVCRSEPATAGYLPSATPSRPLPVQVHDGEMLRRQFYFALAVHERAAQIRTVSRRAAVEKERLLRSARRGAFDQEQQGPGVDAAVATGLLPQTSLPSEPTQKEGGSFVEALHTAASAVAYFWQERR